MTERKYIQIFARLYAKYWLVALILGLGIGLLVAQRLKTNYEGSVTFVVTKKVDSASSANASFYTYDGYYSGQASILARNSFVTWLQSPKTVFDIYQQANAALSGQAASALSRRFTVNDEPNTTAVVVSFHGKDQETTQRINQSMVDYVQTHYPLRDVDVKSSDPLILATDPPKNIVVVGAGLALLFLTFVVTLFVHYFQADSKKVNETP